MDVRIHQSLLRQPYFLDVPREVLILEVLIALLACLVFGAAVGNFLVIGLALLPVHLGAARLTRDDHEALPLLLDAFRYRRFYPAQGALVPQKSFEPRSSLPRV